MPSHLPFAAGSAPSANSYSSSRSVSSSSAPSGPSSSYPSYSRPALLARQHPPADYRGLPSLAQPPPRDYATPSHQYLSHTGAHARNDAALHHVGQGRSLPASSPSPSSSSEDSHNSSGRDVGGNRTTSSFRQGDSRGGGSSEGSSAIPSSSAAVGHSGRKRKRLQRVSSKRGEGDGDLAGKAQRQQAARADLSPHPHARSRNPTGMRTMPQSQASLRWWTSVQQLRLQREVVQLR